MSTEGDNKAVVALRETVAAYAGEPDERWWTGVTIGDLRAVAAAVERLTAERDSARDAAVALEQQTAEVQRIAQDLHARYGAEGFQAAEAILRVLNAGPVELPRRRCAYCTTLAVPGLPNHNDWPVCAEHATQRVLGAFPDDETETGS